MRFWAVARSIFVSHSLSVVVLAVITAAIAPTGAQAVDANRFTIVSRTPPPDTICRNCAQPYADVPLVPPPGFKPTSASDTQLDAYGYPPRPDPNAAPDAYAIWVKSVSIPATRIVPRLRATSLSSGPVQITSIAQGSRSIASGATSNNWSSYTIVDSANVFVTPKSYIYGSFIVPTAQQAFGTCSSTWDHSFEWVGIDGWNSSDVLQAGVEADASCSGGTTTTFYGAWYEWFPNLSVAILNFPIHPGDLILVYVWSTTTTKGHFYMVDLTTNMSSSLAFNAPSGTSLMGTSAEWVVERPGENGVLSTLTNYVTDPFYDCHINVPGHGTYSPAVPHDATTLSVTMVENSADVSYAATSTNNLTYVNPSAATTTFPGTALWFFDEGPALGSGL
jgi:hypothetical protein